MYLRDGTMKLDRPHHDTLRVAAPAAFLLALAANGAAQATYVVDDDPGPGVDFGDLPPAVAAAGPFDTILVRDGTYSSTTVEQGLRILGEGSTSAWIFHDLTVRDVPSGQLVVIAGLRVANDVAVESCDGVVVLEDVRCDGLEVDASFDVRLQRFVAWNPGFGRTNRVVGSRLEAVDSELRGRTGWDGDCAIGDDGELGVEALASFVHVAAAAVRGGKGGYCNESVLGCCPGVASTGGPGLEALDSTVVLSGTAFGDGVFGGDGGETWRIWQAAECPCGADGAGLVVQASAHGASTVRTSNVQVLGNPAETIGAGVDAVAAAGDPVLLLGSAVAPGQPLPFSIYGTPGERIELQFGRSAVRVPVAGSTVERLTSAERRVALGSMPPSGVLSSALSVPASWPAGTVFFLQVRLTEPTAGTSRMSNSAPFVVR